MSGREGGCSWRCGGEVVNENVFDGVERVRWGEKCVEGREVVGGDIVETVERV